MQVLQKKRIKSTDSLYIKVFSKVSYNWQQAIGGYSQSTNSNLSAAAIIGGNTQNSATSAVSAISGMSAASNVTIESLRESLEERDKDLEFGDTDIQVVETPAEKAKREKLLKEQKEKFLIQSLILTWLLLLGIFILGTMFYGWIDYSEAEAQESYFNNAGWPSYDAFDGFRFCIVSLSTVGYGDMYPQTPGGRLFCSLFLLIGVSVLTRVVGTTFEMIGEWEK